MASSALSYTTKHQRACDHGNDLGYDDFLLEDLHGVVGAAGLLLHQDDFPKRSFSQKLQIVEVIHSLDTSRSAT